MQFLEIVIALFITFLAITATLPQFMSTIKQQIVDAITAHLLTLDKALWNIDLTLKSVDPNLRIPRPQSCSVNAYCNLICASEPYRWKNLPDYSSVRNDLYDNYLDPRGRYFAVFQKYNAYLTYTNLGGGVIRYDEICLRVERDIARRVQARLGNNKVRITANGFCYSLNNGAGYEMVSRSYSCP